MTTTPTDRRPPAVDEPAALRFLELPHVAVVGASAARANFGADVVRALRRRGTRVAVVHPSGLGVDDAPGYPDVASLPADVAGAIVMVPPEAAVDVVRRCAERGIRHVWLFRGVGRGAVSGEVLAACDELGLDVVPGACPLMFLGEPGWIHRLHRSVRRARRTLRPAA